MGTFWRGRGLGMVVAVCVVLGACSFDAKGTSDGSPTTPGGKTDTSDAAHLVFDAKWGAEADRELVAGSTVFVDYDMARVMCTGDSHGGPGWTVTMHYKLNGTGDDAVTVLGHESSPGEASKGLFLPEAGDLEVWFEQTSVFGCHAWDSNLSKNYHFAVRGRGVAPDKLGNAAVVIARQTCDGHPCDADRKSADEAFLFDSWGRERAAFRAVYFDVTKAGVTDFDNGDLWKALDVQVHYRYGGKGEFDAAYVGFDSRVEDTARYALGMDAYDPFSDAPAAPACPDVPFSVTSNGKVRATFEYYFTVNDVPLRAAGAKPFKGAFEADAVQYDDCLPGR